VTAPKIIWDFRGNSTVYLRPINPYQITVGNQDIYWAAAENTVERIYAIRGQTLYSPYLTNSSSYTHAALITYGDLLLVADSQPKIYIHNAGSTRAIVEVQTATTVFGQPFLLGYVKVTLKTAMSSGQSVTIALFDSGGNSSIMNTSTKSYTNDGALRSMIFNPSPAAGSVLQFEDIFLYASTAGGAVIERITVYGTPSTDNTQS
jgi:hypothetical protein